MINKYRDRFRVPTNRLRGWDYSSSGYYFITVCVKNRECVLGEIKDKKMLLSDIGKIVEDCWDNIPQHFDNVKLDEFIVMPNHVHGIICINENDNNNRRDVINHVSTTQTNPTPMNTGHLGEIVRWFKGKSSFNIHQNHPSFAWQPRYHDHIIRDETSLQKIQEYIHWNPLNWDTDAINQLHK